MTKHTDASEALPASTGSGPWRVGYYACSVKSGRNAAFPIHVLFAFDRDWEEGSLRQRGLLGNRRAWRWPTPNEIKEVDGLKRAHSVAYRNVEDLITDERASGTDEDFCLMLIRLFPNGGAEPRRNNQNV